MNKQPSIEVEIWSDIMCPFCYMGKRKFEQALNQFADAGQVNVTWRSFQLQPDLRDQPGRNIQELLAESKGWGLEKSRKIHDQLADQARQLGLDYQFDKVVIANSFQAHRLIHLAKSQGLGDQAEERIFRAYFTEGKNTGDPETLMALGLEIGLAEAAVREMLGSDQFADQVHSEMAEAQTLGINGVPFFVIDRKWCISGAQDPQVFVAALEKARAESVAG